MLRNEKGLSQSELAKALNVHQTAVSQWEMGRTAPDKSVLILLSAFFDVSIEFLLERTADRKPSSQFSFTPEERAIVEKLRKLSPDKRGAIETLIWGL